MGVSCRRCDNRERGERLMGRSSRRALKTVVCSDVNENGPYRKDPLLGEVIIHQCGHSF